MKTKGPNPNPTAQAQSKHCFPLSTKTQNIIEFVSILTHMGCSWQSFGDFGETLGLHFGTLGLHLGTLGVHGDVLWALLGMALDPSAHFCGKCSKKTPKMDVEMTTNSTIF